MDVADKPTSDGTSGKLDRLHVVMVEQGGRGGVADYTAELVAALAAEGVAVTLATARDHLYEPRAGVRIWTPFWYVRAGGRFRDAVRAVQLHKLIHALAFILAVPRIALRGRHASLVHLQGGRFPPLYLVLILALRLGGCRVVHTPHNTFDRGMSLGLARRLTMRLVDRIVLHTEADVGRVPAAARERAHVIPHGEYAGFAARGGSADRATARRDLGLGDDSFVALIFGQLRLDKGVADALKAARRLPGVQLLLAGEDRGALAATRDLRGSPELAGRVHVFEGFHRHEDVPQFFGAADVVLLPYHQVSQSGVLLLAYAFERPVIAYPVGGLAEAVEHGSTGWLTTRAGEDALVSALEEAMRAGADELQRRGREARRLAHERYSWEGIARRTIAVYGEALA